MYNAFVSPRLEVAALGLEGRDLEIATVIAEETEAERLRQLAALPPSRGPSIGLLGGADAAQIQVEQTSWDEWLIRGASVQGTCCDRLNIGVLDLVQFALDRLAPRNWLALFWYRNWLAEAVTHKLPMETVQELIRDAQQQAASESAKTSGRRGADLLWTANREAREHVRQEWAARKTNYRSKAEFAREMAVTVKSKFEAIDNITARTISDDWLRGL